MLARVHQYLELLDLDPLERLERSERAWRIQVKPQIGLDEALIARRALLYSERVVIRDPAELIRPPEREIQDVLQPWPGMTSGAHEHWRELWQSAFYGLGTIHKLVNTGIVSLYPAATASHQAAFDPSSRLFRRERRQVAELRALYRTDEWASILRVLPFGDREEAGIHAGWALGQFAWRNVVLPGATPWMPTAHCLTALTSVERALKHRVLGPESLTLARLSSRLGIDLGKVSDDDIIAMRGSEALFATWRRLVAELCLEVDRLDIDNGADITTLVKAKEALWHSELEQHTGRGGVLSGLFDTNPIVCGVITGGAALASGVSPALSAVSALGGGLVTPLLRLLGNLAGTSRATARKQAVSAHFMALEG